jgi:hypothetical protein
MTYFMHVSHTLEAESIKELAELVDCAIDAGDTIEWHRASGGRRLSPDEFAELFHRVGAAALPSNPKAWTSAQTSSSGA